MTKEQENFLFKAGFFAIVYFAVVRPLFTTLGIQKTVEQKETIKEIKQVETAPPNENPWDPNFWRQFPNPLIFNGQTTQSLIDDLWNCSAPNWLYQDNESCIYSVFSKCKTQSQVSWLALNFQEKYRNNLFKFLQTGRIGAPWAGLSDSEIKSLIDSVKNKPKYKL